MSRKKPSQSEAAAPTYLSSGDLVAMILSEKDLALSAMQVTTDRLVLKNLELSMAQRLADLKAQLQSSIDRQAQHASTHRRLAEDVAARYRFDWNSSSFVPETGEIVATP